MKRLLQGLMIICFSTLQSQDLELTPFSFNLNRPVNIKHAGDDRLFVVEQQGIIRVLDNNGNVNATPFLNINDSVINIGSIGDERGLLGLAFHPSYQTNGFFYVNYINNSGDTVISRFTRSSENINTADAGSELIILSYSQPFSNHNGGDLAFGSDGYLYIASGDGGSGGDPLNNGQDLDSFLGKILRIDIDATTTTTNYAIPADNPFIGTTDAKEEIWAYGLRNPWKFSFDRLTGDLWIADVGQNQIEEINLASSTAAGLNYGWRCYEGNAVFNASGCPADATLTFPVSSYSHFGDGAFKCSITGGYRYRGATYENFTGAYFFADYCSGEIGYLSENGSSWDMVLQSFSGNWTAFGEDVNGELYIADINTGTIYQLVDASDLSITDLNQNTFKITPNPVTAVFNFNLPNLPDDNAHLTIYNALGSEVLKKSIFQKENKVEVTHLSSGLYLIKLQYNGQQYSQKLIIQ